MAYPSVTFRDFLENATVQELDQLCSLLQGYLNLQHKADGSHRAITADSVSSDGAGTFGGDVTAQNGSAAGTVQIGALSSVIPSISDKRGLLIAGSSGLALLRYGRSGVFTGSGSLYQFALWNLDSTANNAWLQLADDSGVPTLIDGGTGAAGLNLGNANRPITAVVTKAHTLTQNEVQSGVLSPSTITGNQNNYNPTGLATARILRLTVDAARTITGLAAQPSGTRLTLFNATGGAGFDITLAHADTVNSSAANVFVCPGFVNYTLQKGGGVDIWYDGTSSVWRLVA